MMEAFSKVGLTILPEFRNLSYRLISHRSIGFIFDNWYQHQFNGHFSLYSGHLLPILLTILRTTISEMILQMH